MDHRTVSFDALLRGAGTPAGRVRLTAALGLAPAGAADVTARTTPDPDVANAPEGAVARALLDPAAYGGLRRAGVARARIVGRAGTLLGLEVEPADDVEVERAVRRLAGHNPAVPHLFLVTGPGTVLTLAAMDGAGRLQRLQVDRRRPRRTDIACLEEMAARPGEEGLVLHRRMVRALERSRVTRRFFRDFSVARARVAQAWTGIGAERTEERGQLALLFLCRLMFLYFLQRRGCLAGDTGYMAALATAYRRERAAERAAGEGAAGHDADDAPAPSFYRLRLRPLFFGALNTRPGDRSPDARALGPLPYLNGGLFERHAHERRFPRLDLPDDVVLGVFDVLLERYRFTTREASDGHPLDGDPAAGGVDPEMLGRVFEGLMDRGRRGRTGSFYTPSRVVGGLVREALATYVAGNVELKHDDAVALVAGRSAHLPASAGPRLVDRLRDVRVLDPACGSGAFLLDALARLHRALRAAGDGRRPAEIRRELVARSLHGVDLLDDAALLCALRLWLALTLELDGDAPVPPLPNLDRRIRQGDALVDPLDLGAGNGDVRAARDPVVRRSLRALVGAGASYASVGPERREPLKRELRAAERDLARAWMSALGRRLDRALAESRARGSAVDLFGERPPDAERAREEARRLARRIQELDAAQRALEDDGALPFFSFGVHFPEAAGRGFDLVLSNPPWVRAHRWPASLRDGAARFEVVRRAGWPRGAALAGAPPAAGGQVDLALLFLERAVRLLAPGGVLAMVLPAKALRALYGGGARRMLLRELQVVALEDHALDQRSIFRADAFAATLVARKPARPNGPGVARVTLIRRGAAPLRFALPQDALPVVPGDAASPWLLAPPDARAAFRAMQAAGPPLGDDPGLRVRRGVFTGANRLLLFQHAQPKLGGLVLASPTGGGDDVVLEGVALRPCLRGTGIDAWRFRADRHLLWSHDDATGEPVELPRHAARWVDRHAEPLRRRSGWRPGMPEGAIFRVRPDCVAPKVAWQDLADTLKAVALPATVRAADGVDRPLIPLNTVYYIPVASPDDALALAALLNSTPATAFARAVAERAKDARFRFFAWTVALIPLPPAWRTGEGRQRLLELARRAHGAEGLDRDGQLELDRLVARLYDLDHDALDAIHHFDRWLRGVTGPDAEETP